jgi:hypothetical protein
MKSWIKIELTWAVFLIFILTGCSERPKPLYHYGSYSESYYASKKYPGEVSAITLENAMQESIDNAQESQSGRVPPGMYANLGYRYLKNGKSAQAISLFIKEKRLYPESAHFMDRMIKKVEASQKSSHE